MEPTSRLDRNLKQLIDENGIDDVLAALCRYCREYGLERVFIKLHQVYEWLINQR